MCEEQPKTIIEYSSWLRTKIKDVASAVKSFKSNLTQYPERDWEDRWEVIANIMLAYRHLEDARMRLWKVIEAVEWQNIYDK